MRFYTLIAGYNSRGPIDNMVSLKVDNHPFEANTTMPISYSPYSDVVIGMLYRNSTKDYSIDMSEDISWII